MFRRICLTLGLASLCFNAAAKAPAIPSPVAQELPVELILTQHELAVEVPATAMAVGMQFGLIGALIGGAVQNAQATNAEQRVTAMRDQLVEYHFNERIEAAVRAKLASEGISPNPRITVRQSVWDAAEANAAPATMQALVLVPRYAVTNDFQQMTVSLATSLVERTRKSNGKYKTQVLFNRNYRFEFPMTASEGKEEMSQRWAGMGRTGLSTLLDQGIQQTTDMLVHDFSAAGRSQWTSKPVKKAPFVEVNGRKVAGRQIQQGEGWVWIRSGSGRLQQFYGVRTLDAAAVAALSAPAAVAPASSTAAAAPASVPAQAEGSAPAADAQAAASAPVNAAPVAAPAEAASAPVGSGQ
ncbi:hypothetical protein [Agrilutibacter solisilvae]|uniref:Uncharacterized protein n=1 Tax=Agrilutibacter solisilvae TaxID=2763317 RepID=A0A974XZD1_9GAMM|nr:hypothetical protein [Lysobacter solisilvae]QSX78581.1 hypothetical protein I8J32_001130 [Lysobacter solisilvae]